MSSELVTAVEVGRSLYIYKDDILVTSIISHNSPIAEAVAGIRSKSENFRHIRVSHTDWNTLLDWEDRVAKSSLSSLLDSTEHRGLTVTYPQPGEI